MALHDTTYGSQADTGLVLAVGENTYQSVEQQQGLDWLSSSDIKKRIMPMSKTLR
jgi:hypothetical protein